MKIHPTAIIHPKAHLATDVEIGPFSVVGEHVESERAPVCSLMCRSKGGRRSASNCELHPFVSVGGPPQHLQYKGEPTTVIIGHDNILREYVTVNRATAQGGGQTTIGDHNFLMAYVHVAHDCHLGNHLILANAASLAGHISIGDHAIIGGLTGIHQYVRIGPYSMVGGCCALGQDLPPFMSAAGGYRARMYGLNSIGLRRHGFSGERITALKHAYDLLFRSGHRVAEAVSWRKNRLKIIADVLQVASFMEGTKRGICRRSARTRNMMRSKEGA